MMRWPRTSTLLARYGRLVLQALFERWSGVPAGTVDGWELVPFVVDDKPAAIAAVGGVEIHFAVDPEWRGRLINRARVRSFLAPLLSRRGYLTTRVAGNDDFVRRIGFVPTWDDGTIRHYILYTIPFERQPCQ